MLYQKKVTIVIHDQDVIVTARNAILLLVALATEDERTAVDCMLHIWYSALITEQHSNMLQSQVLPLIEEVVNGLPRMMPFGLVSKRFTFGDRSLSITLQVSEWRVLLSMLSPSGLSPEEAQSIRRAITIPPGRADYRDRRLYTISKINRVTEMHFRHDGIVLPLGWPREDHAVPNP